MTADDWSAIRARKESIRRREAERPYGEKLDQLDRLRERSTALWVRSGPPAVVREPPPSAKQKE